MSSAKIGLVLDTTNPEGLAEFWAPALGYMILGGAGNYVLLVDEANVGPKLLLQRVSEPKTTKNRMHFDIETPDVDGEVARLVALGARRVDGPVSEHGSRWVVMSDPDGNEFCVCDGGQA
jgi:predicted enzyme related to lactoylglutathione lyase